MGILYPKKQQAGRLYGMKQGDDQYRQKAREVIRDSTQLPDPDPDQVALSDSLKNRIRQTIASHGGSISFEQFMQMALYEPDLGYYTSGLRKFGKGGDFVTAPELSPLFGRCLARFCLQISGMIPDYTILEFCAGSGKMAADILSELDRLKLLPSTYLILELSAELQQRQYETLEAQVPHLLDRVQWLQEFPEQGFEGIVLANELLDAMLLHLKSTLYPIE